MPLAWYECDQCHRTLRRCECERLDDPMAPWGPELLCRHCGGLAAPRYHPLLIAIAVIAAAALGFGITAVLAW